MPTYHYICEVCGLDSEIVHPMRRCEDETIVNEIRNERCTYLKENGVCSDECKLRRIISGTSFAVYESASADVKRNILAERSKQHYKKEIAEKARMMNDPKYIP